MKHLKPGMASRSEWTTRVYWDIEGADWSTVLCVCAVTSDGREHVSFSIAEHLAWLESEDLLRRDVVHWAHFGGIYDHVLLMAEALPLWELQAGTFTSGFNAWSADMRRGDLWLRLRDSGRIYPCALALLGQLFDCPKGDVPRDKIKEAWAHDRTEVIRYCFRDCHILKLAIESMEEQCAALGVAMRGTLAATSTALIRATAVPADAWEWRPSQDKKAYLAYFGGRTERFARWCGKAWLYDVVSSYPAAMSQELPTRLAKVASGRVEPGPTQIAFYLARVEVPADCEYPPLPYRVADGDLRGTLSFPTGTWEGWFVGEELDFAAEHFGVKILRVRQTRLYESETWCKPFMDHWFRVKAEATNEGHRFTAKIMINGVYGKTVENPERDEFTTMPSRVEKIVKEAMRAEHEEADLSPKVFASHYDGVVSKVGRFTVTKVTSRRWGGFRHAAAGAVVCARGRIALLCAIVDIRNRGGKVFYCDTDSIVSSIPMSPEYATGRLGAFKLEGTITSGEFLRAKLYKLDFADGSVAMKAKGFPVPRKPKDKAELPSWYAAIGDLWTRLVEGKAVVWESHVGARTALAERRLGYSRETFRRALRGGYDKREFAKDGSSRPWDVGAIDRLTEKRHGQKDPPANRDRRPGTARPVRRGPDRRDRY